MKNNTVVIGIYYDYFYPAYKAGGPIQSLSNLVNQLSGNFSFKIFCSDKDLDGTKLTVTRDKWVTYNNSTDVWYTSKKKIFQPFNKIKLYSSRPDILYINGIYSWQFNLFPLLFCKASKKIIAARGMLHPGALSQKSLKKKIYIATCKFLLPYKKCFFHATNEDEKIYIQKAFGKHAKIFVAQNFPRVFSIQPFPPKKTNQLFIFSLALISAMKNHLLVINSLMNYDGDITYNIYGPIKDAVYWKECIELIKKLPTNIVVKYHGDVSPENVEDVIAQNHLCILPSKSENFGHSIYEALTAGRPVITSNYTPWNNLEAEKAGINVTIENTEELTKAIKKFAAMDNIEFEEWHFASKRYSVNAINISSITEQYKNMFTV